MTDNNETEEKLPPGIQCENCTLCGTSEPPATIESEGEKSVEPCFSKECPYCNAMVDVDWNICPYCSGNLNPDVFPMLGVTPIE